MKRLLILHAATAVLVVACTPVTAATVCLRRDVMVERLTDRYEEARIGVGLVNESSLVELFASETGTWTMVVTTTTGQSCAVASGTDWIESGMVALEGDPT